MDREIYTVIAAVIPQIIMIFGIFWFVMFIQKKSFKEISERFSTAEQMPADAIRLAVFAYGMKIRLKNAVKIAENTGKLFIKIPLNPLYAVPYSDVIKVEIREQFFNNRKVVINIKDIDAPISMLISESKLSQFPQLKSIAGEEGPRKNIHPKISKEDFSRSINYHDPFIKDKIGNAIRIGIFILIAIILIIFALN